MLDQYRNSLIKEMNTAYQDRIKILLDTNQYINIRKSLYEQWEDNESEKSVIYKKIFFILKRLVESEIVVCPLTSYVISEIAKISDDKNFRQETIEIVSSLSSNCSLNAQFIPMKEKINYFRLENGESMDLHYQFTPLCMEGATAIRLPLSTTGYSYHINDEELRNYYREKVFNEDIKSFFARNSLYYHKYAKDVFRNTFCKRTARENTLKFNDLLISNLTNGFQTLSEWYQPNSDTLSSIHKDACLGKQITKADIKKDINTFRDYTKFHYSLALIFSALYIDKKRKYKKNDFEDIGNGALSSYIDYYFTEQSFANLLSQGTVGLNSLYNVKIKSNPQDILDALNDLEVQ